MAEKPKPKLTALLDLYRIFLGLAIFEGFFALWSLVRVPSDKGSAIFAGLSLQRITVLFTILLVFGLFVFSLFDSFRSQKFLKFLASRLDKILDFEIYQVFIKSFFLLLLLSSLATLLLYLFPGLDRLIFFLPNIYVFTLMGTQAGLLVGWLFLICLKILFLFFVYGKKASHTIPFPVRLMTVSWTVEIFVFLYLAVWSLITRKFPQEILEGPGVKIFILSVWFSVLSLLSRWKGWAGRVSFLFSCISVWVCVFVATLQIAQWFNVGGLGSRGQFALLAASLLDGKLYLITLPNSLHDLTFYNGHWYVPYPPFPILLYVPLIALLGVDSINFSIFTMMLAATAAVTVYLILNQLIQFGWIKISRSSAAWLTALFSFGTVIWWLSFVAGPSFYSQVVTILFYGLAFLAVLKKYSPWIPGICLAAAVMSRPNVIVLWPALLAIAIQLNMKDKRVNWKQVFKWSLLSAIPVILGVGLLFYYNYLRFGNFLDFGYTTINGSDTIVSNIQKYGLFNMQYAPFNLRSIFFLPPELKLSCGYYIPRGWGMSIVFTTPAVIYLFRKAKINWWIGGCWVSIILSIILLALYSNNGANQYGYRYVMDFMIPVIMIIAFNMGEKVSGILKTLIIASISINYYGVLSWYKSPC